MEGAVDVKRESKMLKEKKGEGDFEREKITLKRRRGLNNLDTFHIFLGRFTMHCSSLYNALFFLVLLVF